MDHIPISPPYNNPDLEHKLVQIFPDCVSVAFRYVINVEIEVVSHINV